jgi:hypothetical protein
MKVKLLFILILIACLACNTDKKNRSESMGNDTESEISFNKEKWSEKIGPDYPYRDQMLNDLVYNDTIRELNKDEIIELLGQPDKINEGHLYYLVTKKSLGPWPLHTKNMVIKLSEDNSIEWIKIHK